MAAAADDDDRLSDDRLIGLFSYNYYCYWMYRNLSRWGIIKYFKWFNFEAIFGCFGNWGFVLELEYDVRWFLRKVLIDP